MALDLAPGAAFAGHRIDAIAGRGGMGVVYRATDLALDRPVALKLIAPALAQDPVFRTRFNIEARTAAAIDHPNVVQVFHAGEQDGVLYVTMRFIEGTDLGTLVAGGGRLEPARAVALLTQVAGALDAAHAHGLVHRDVKPANVLIEPDGAHGCAYLTDFGVSKVREDDTGLTEPGFVMGTADYIAPEQARGSALDGRADVYALGCVLFRTLTGSCVFPREGDLEKLWAHLHDPPPSPLEIAPDLPRGFDHVLRRALAKDPDDRHQTAAELLAQAAAVVEGRASGSGAQGRPPALRVVVAEDSVLLRAGVVRLLEDAGFEVVAQAGDLDELLAEVRARRPDVAVTDLKMPPNHSDEGLRAARTIRAELPGTGVLVLSQYVEPAYAEELLGGSPDGVGYLLKDRVTDSEGFAEAVERVGRGGTVLDPGLAS